MSALHRLLQKSDVLLHRTWRHGRGGPYGPSYEQLKTQFPGLLFGDISGYGADGPDRDRKAYDLLIQSEGEVLSTLEPREPK